MNYKDFKFETERLSCRIIDQTYAEDIFNTFTSVVTKYMTPCPAKDISETRSFINMSIRDVENETSLLFVILDKTNGNFLGCLGLHSLNKPAPEIGIWLKKGAHGYGYGKEAVTSLVEWSKKHLGIKNFIYPVDKRNLSSRKIPESLGGKIHKEYQSVGFAGNKLDQVEYLIET